MDDSDLSTFRTERLQEAIVRVSSGNKTAFGRKLGFKDGAFIRQMLNGERAITEKTVRAIESLQGMKGWRSEEHTSELQSLMRISYAVFCLKKKRAKQTQKILTTIQTQS